MAISTIGASALDSGVAQLGKNLIINGAMTVAQRGTSFTGLGTAAAYTLDRWKLDINGSPEARVTITQDTDVPSGQSFASSLKIDVTTAESAVASNETFHVFQNIEAQNLQLLAYNTASAKTMALSFWFKSPKSGTHCVTIDNQDGGSTYIREFTVASADTWEKHSVTFPGDTAAGINNDNGTGLTLIFPLINGTTYHGTANTWTGSGTQWSTSNQQNLLDNTANNIYITGVQLEVGSVSRDFEHEDYGTTLAKCLRYYWLKDMNNPRHFTGGYETSSGNGTSPPYTFPQVMRAAPTITWNGTYQLVENGAVADTTITVAGTYIEVSTACMNVVSGSISNGGYYGVTKLSGTCTVEHDAEL